MIARPNFASFSPASYLARAEAGDLAVSRIADGKLLWRQGAAHQGAIVALAWSPDGQWLASAGRDGSIHIWDATTGEHLTSFFHGEEITRLLWSERGTLASSSASCVHLWILPSSPVEMLHPLRPGLRRFCQKLRSQK